jgi:hypothetical protein
MDTSPGLKLHDLNTTRVGLGGAGASNTSALSIWRWNASPGTNISSNRNYGMEVVGQKLMI